MTRRLSKLIKLLIGSFLCLFLMINLWQLYSRIILKERIPSIFGYSQVIVLSGSMEPVFSAGDVLIIAQQNEFKEGEIVTFWEDDTLITHRLIQNVNGSWITKGDANNSADLNLVEEDMIVGTLVCILPKLGVLILFLNTPIGILLIILLLAAILLLPEWFLIFQTLIEERSMKKNQR